MILRKITEYIREKKIGAVSGEAVRYLIAGVATTLVNFALFALLTRAIGVAVTVSNVTAISASILFAYIVNKHFVFRRRCETKAALAREFIKFVGSRLFTMALEVAAVLLFVDVLAQDPLIGKAIAQVLVVIANYIISKLIVFRKS